MFLVFLILLVTTLHLISQLVSSIFDLLVPRVFIILAFGSWVPVGQVGVLLVLVLPWPKKLKQPRARDTGA